MDILLNECLTSNNPSAIKGGLLGAAALIVATEGQNKDLLSKCISPILDSAKSPDGRIRLYAAESLLNIIKASHENCLAYFEKIFKTICILRTDMESDVNNVYPTV